MSTIAPHQFPGHQQPFTFQPPQLPATAPQLGWPGAPFGGAPHQPAPSPAPRRPRRGIVVACVAIAITAGVGAGVKAARGEGSSSSTRTPVLDKNTSDTKTSDRNDKGDRTDSSALSTTELSGAYKKVFGTAASSSTLSCLGREVEEPADVRAFAAGRSLGFDAAYEMMRPFVRCAPDDDFLHEMVPAAIKVIGGGDEGCVRDILVDFGEQGRAEALALAYDDPEDFLARLETTFAECAV